jgi:hypothetical protein
MYVYTTIIYIYFFSFLFFPVFLSRHVTQLSTNQVVTQTSKDIARLTVLMRRGDKQQKLQIEKLTTDFKDALQRYSDMQKVYI